MPIKIPRLQQVQASPTLPKNERINVNVQDSASSIIGRTNAVADLAQTGVDVYEGIEDKKIALVNAENDNEFTEWHNQRLEELSKITDGDPTDAYNAFETEVKEKREEILAKRPNLSGRAATNIELGLNKSVLSGRTQMLNQRGAQARKYEHKVYVANINVNRDELAFKTTNVKKDGMDEFGVGIENIKTIIAKKGLETGASRKLDKDDKGSWDVSYPQVNDEGKIEQVKIAFNPLGAAEKAKELDKGVYDALVATLDSGHKDKASIVYDKYKKYLTADSNAKYLKKVKDKDKTEDAYKLVNKVLNKPKEKQEAYLKSLKPSEEKTKALNIIAGNKAKMKAIRTDREDANYEVALKEVEKLKASNNLNSMIDIEENKVISGEVWDNLSAKQQKSLKQMVNMPKVSDKQALTDILELVNGNNKEYPDVIKMPESKFVEYLTGLNAGDRGKMLTRYKTMKTQTKSVANTQALYNHMSKKLKTKLFAKKLIKRQKYNNRLTPKSQTQLDIANDDMQAELEVNPPQPGLKSQNEWLDNYIKQKQKESMFGGVKDTGPGFFARLFGAEDEVTPAEVVKKASIQNEESKVDPFADITDPTAFAKWQFKYKLKFKTKLPPKRTDKVFRQFVRDERGLK